MGIAYYEQIEAKLKLYQKLDDSEIESNHTTERFSHKEIIQALRDKLNGKKV